MMRYAAALAGIAAACSFPARAAFCANLTSLTIPNATITSASIVTPGPFLLPGDRALGAERSLPEHCRVTAVARPVADSEIKIEIWLPESDQWNDRFLGTTSIGRLQSALRRDYAVAGSATHTTEGIHVMTQIAKLVVRSYYRQAPEHSYFSGCGKGGQQALSEAQLYPDDYDGIIADGPSRLTGKYHGKVLFGRCGGGPTSSTFDALGALDNWVTRGIAPENN